MRYLLKNRASFIPKFALFLVFFSAQMVAYAQTVDCSISGNCGDSYCQFAANIEKGCNCFDGLDNDGDGKVDKADSNCATYYGLIFVGDNSDCSIIPPGANDPFDLVDEPSVSSSQNTVDTQSKISIGDVDGDGIPDAVVTSKFNQILSVIATTDNQADGSDNGDQKAYYKLTGQGAKIFSGSGACKPGKLYYEHENMIADIDGDGVAEIFGIVSNRSGDGNNPPTCFWLVSFRYVNGELVPMYDAVQIGSDRPGTFGIADMDGDGKAEVYIRDRIYAAETGVLLASGNGNWDLDINSAPVAVNILGDQKMELVCGTKIYSIPNLSNRTPATPATLTLAHDMNTITANKCYVKLMVDLVEYGTDTHSSTSVADVDRDGVIDVVISGALNSPNGPTAIFYWNVAKSTVSYYIPTDPGYVNGWPWGAGRVNLGDANGDGRTDFSFVAGNRLHCLTTDASGNLVPLWTSPRIINDTRSGVIAVTIYDFENDGNPEMVYRDSQELTVIDGATGTTKLWSATCQSHTYTEGPIIADVNGDGATDICVPCNTSKSFDITDPIQQQALGQIRLYFSSGNEWLPTRKVWNQPGYFVVNINDDLTLPFPQMDQNLVFGDEACLNGLPGPQMPMNVFLNQVPYLAANGCPVFPAPDLSFTGDNPDTPGVDEDGDGIYRPTVEVIPPICGDLGVSVRFHIINDGDLPISANIPVSFFVGDPTDPGITSDSLIHSTTLPISNLMVDSTYTSPFITFNATGAAFRLFIVLNNDGSVLPIDPGGAVTNECRIDNNIYSAFIQPDPFTTKIEKISDNFKCENSAPDNGEVRVRIYKAGVEVTDYSQYGFQWYTGTAANHTLISGATNYNLTGLGEGDYTAIVTNTAKGCVGVPVDTVVLRQGNDPEVVINVISHQTKCSPPNGELQAQITGGNTGFVFEWYDIALNPLGISGNTANNLVAGNYIVRVSKDGCTKNSLPQTVDGPVVPDAQAATLVHVEDCLNPNSGSVTATALFNGAPQDPANYSFEWYFYNNATFTRGSILPAMHGTGETRTGLPVGHYQVVVTDLATQCAAVQTPITEITSQTIIPTAVITELAPLTSCDPANPNGRLSASALVGGVTQDPSTFTFEWFKGDNTLAANAHTDVTGVNGSIAESVSGGGVFYTVRITTGNNCSDTEKLIITEDLNVPVVTLATTDNGICDPALAASDYSGTVTASVSFDGVAVSDFTNYEITWHDGPLDTNPVIAGETSTLLDERNGGFYTVVVERTDLGCVSAPVSAEVLNATVLPTILTDSIPSTNCAGGTANGGVIVTSVIPADTYTYRWFDPSGTLIGGATTNAISGRQGGTGQNYTVEVTLGSTGCRNTFATNIPDNKLNPILTLTPSDNSICDGALGFNGSITSAFTDTNAQAGHTYAYVWSTGSDMTNPMGSQTGSSLTQQDGGFYTATIRNTTLNCTSSPVTTEILNNQVLPAISAAPTPSTNCPGGADNGAITASVTNGLAGQTFAFQWSKGNLVSDPDVPAINGGNTATITGQQGNHNYVVLARNNQTGCENTFIQAIADHSVVPVLTLKTTDNSICDIALGYNGTVSRDVITDVNANGTDTYSFVWSSGSDMTSPIGVTDPSDPTLTGQNGGFYTATVQNDRLGCVSNPVTIEVNNNQVLPAIAATPTPATNCDPALANGGITVSISNALAGQTFTYEWHKGSLMTDPAVPAPQGGNTASIFDQVGNQNYIVQARNNQTGCLNTLIQTIADHSVVPALTLLATDNSICDPGLGYNGTVSRDAITDVNANGTDTYSFTWSSGNDMSSPIFVADPADPTLTGQNGGFYSVTVENDRLGCVSNPTTIEVNNNQILPAFAATPTPATNCDPALANGAITVSVTNALAGQTFTYEWHQGNLMTDPAVPALKGGNTVTIFDQAGNQNYIVQARNEQTGCLNTFIQTIADDSVVPGLELITTDNSICDAGLGYNGTVSRDAIIDVNTNGTDTYTFVWSAGNDMSSPISVTDPADPTLTGRDGGFYTVTVENDRLGCVSNPVTAQVLNNQILPAISSVPSPSTNCPTGTPNGKIDVTITNPLAGQTFSFDWFAGTLTTDPVVPLANGGETANVSNIQGGQNYLVVATNDQTGCANSFIQLLADDSEVPVLTLLPSHNSICDILLGYNGSITQNSLTDPNALGGDTYTFAWATGTDMSAVILGESTPTLTGRDGGFYTATVTNDRLKCTSNPVTVEIINNQILPAIAATPKPSTNCLPDGAPNGEISVTITNTLAGQTLTFEWHKGNLLTDPAVLPADGGTSDHIVNQQGGSNYLVQVTIDQTGCSNTLTQPLQDISALPMLTLTPTPNTMCVANPVYNGSITSSFSDPNNEAGHTYEYTWSDGMDMLSIIAGETGASIDELDGGYYTATVTNTSLGCTSNPVLTEVMDDLTLPAITTAPIPSTNCPGGDANGEITASVTNGLPGQTFSYAWFAGTVTSDPGVDPALGGNSETIFDQQGGQLFTVEATTTQTGCANTQTLLLEDDSELPVITPLGHTDNINCTFPFNGTAFVDAATPFTYRGSTITGPYTGFTLTWSGGTVLPGLDQTTELAAGTYNLQVRHDADNCVSTPVSVTILNDLTLPAVDIVTTDQTSCNPAAPNGELVATVGGGTAGHSFQWFNGIGTTAPSVDITNAVTPNVASDLESDNYTTLVVNTSTRCSTTITTFLPDKIVNPSISFQSVTTVTSCASPNGEATPTLTGIATPPNTAFTVYYVRTFTGDAYPTNPAVIKASTDTYTSTVAVANGTNPPVITGLSPGYLTGLVVDHYTGCESPAVTVQIEDATDENIITITGTPAAGFCGGDGGGISIDITGGVGPHTIEWYRGTPTNSDINFYNNPPAFATPVLATTEDLGMPGTPPGVNAGSYTVVVTDAVGCGSYFVENVPFTDMPTVTITKADVTKCDPGPYDGAINVSVDGTPLVTYDIILYEGNSPVVNLNATAGVENVVLNTGGLESGQYLIRVIDNTPANIACPLDYQRTLIQDVYSPIVTIDDIIENTACDDTNFADGQISITANKDALDSSTPTYSITSISPVPLGFTAPFPLATGVNSGLISGFAPTTYTITVADALSGCVTNTDVTIPDQPQVPQLINVTVKDESFCAPQSNGGAEVTTVNPIAVDDYEYTWYSDAALSNVLYQANGTLTGGGELFDATKSGYAAGTAGQGYGDQTVHVRGERLPGTGAGVGCPTPAVTVLIKDKHITPVATLSSMPDTYCAPGTGDGSITLTATTADPGLAGSTYQYDVQLGAVPLAQLTGQNGAIASTFPGLEDASPYTVYAMNEVSGCVTQNDIAVQPILLPAKITDHTFNDQLICYPNGDITVTEIEISRAPLGLGDQTFAAALGGDFDFQWFRANPATPGTFDATSPLQDAALADIDREVLEPGIAGGQYPTMGAGTYYVVATRIAGATLPVVGLGCSTPPLRVDIKDQHVNPVVTLTPFSNTSCSTLVFEGEIDVDVSDASPGSFGPFDYTYGWPVVTSTTVPGPLANPYTGDSSTDGPFAGLKEGDYTINIINNQTGCQAIATTTIFKNTTPIFVAKTKAVPQYYCDPSGRLEVTEINYEDRNGTQQTAPLNHFDFTWSRTGVGAVGATLPLLDSTVTNYPGIGAGLYAVFATRTSGSPGLDCVSAPVNLQITDESVDPVLTLTPFSNTSCTADFEGEIKIEISDNSKPKVAPSPDAGQPVLYDYTWTDVDGAGLFLPANDVGQTGSNDLYSGLEDGKYRLTVVNSVTGCTTQATTTIIKNQTPVFVQNVTTVPQFYCDPSGNLDVVEVKFNDRDGVTQDGPLVDFVYEWSRTTLANVIATTDPLTPLPGHTGTELDSIVHNPIGAGSYWVVATRQNGTPGAGCSSAPFRVDIADKRISPVITLTPFSNTSCTAAFEGEIQVDVEDGSAAKIPPVAFAYDYAWSVVTPVGLGLPPNQIGQNGQSNRYSNLEDGTYKLTATNTVTGCSAEASTTIIKNQTPVFLTVVNPTPQFYCDPSGRLEVTDVNYNDRDGNNINGLIADFTFRWARGSTGNTVATTIGSDPRGAFLDSLIYAGIGYDPDYYVVATRTTGSPGAGCSSAPIKVEITDKREYPMIALTPFSNTSCTAAFEGEIKIEISDHSKPKVAPSPDAGQPVLYDYTWTDVNTAGLALPAPAAGQTGSSDLYSNLGEGTYKVTAVNTITGCSSEATTTIIKNQTPVFLTVVNPTPQFYCDPSGKLEITGVTYKDRDGATQIGALADFTFAWARGTVGNTIATIAGNTPRGAFLDSLAYPAIGFDSYYVVATRTNGAPGAGCASAPIKVDVVDKREYPVITLTPFSNTSCTADFEGEIAINILDNSATKIAPSPDAGQPILYDYTWTDVNTAGLALPAPAAAQSGSGNLYSNLQDGTYKVAAVNTITGCSSEATTTIIKNQTPIFIQDIAMTPQFYCAPSGHLEVRSITYNDRDGVSQPGPLANFTFDWMRNDLATAAGSTDGSQVRGTFLDSLSYTGPGTIGVGTYYVVATRDSGVPGAGCQSAPFRVDITDKRQSPVVGFTTVANTACDNNFDGRITVLSSTADAPGAGANYDIDWLSFPAGNALVPASDVGGSYTTPLTDIIGPGSFTVRVTNRVTNCFSEATVDMISNPQPVEILTVNKVDQFICLPDGSMTVSAVSPAVVTDYDFNWFRGQANSTALVDGSNTTIIAPTLDNTNYLTIGADTYFVVGQKTSAGGSGCLTAPFRVELDDLHVDPTLAFTFVPNSSCDVTNPNGEVIALAGERDGTTDNYTFAWTLNGAALPGVTTQTDLTPNSHLDNASEGQYTLIVTNTVTGCTFMAGTNVNLDHNISLPNIITVDTTDPLDCLASGSAEVTSISVGGGPAISGPALGTDFQYEWYQDDFVPANQMANLAPLLPGINPGRYFVLVQDLTTDCKSAPTEVVIADDDIVYPVVTIEQTALQVQCVSEQGTAALEARGDGNTDANPDYHFSWFNGLETSGPVFSSTSTITDLSDGEYSVSVTNDATGCSASNIYVIRDDSEKYLPKLSLNTEGRTDCLQPNGALLAREVGYDQNDGGYPYPSANYSAEWYIGANADVSQPGAVMAFVPGFINRNWRQTDLDVQTYTVKITDNNTGCIVTGAIDVEDNRVLPVVAIVEDNPLINCDPARPNAQLSATADGGKIGGYLFDWYSGATASGTVLTSNDKLIGVGMGDYTVRVTHSFTHCAADATASVTDGRLMPPTPTAVLVRDRIRCDYPDGWVSANVGGITFNYSFDWYDGSTTKAVPDFNGVNYLGRDIGLYTVTAMDEVTGCVSAPVSVEVNDMRVTPVVIVRTTPSYCEELPGSTGGTGTAEVELQPADVVSDEVIWTLENDAATLGIGSYLTNVLPGFYQANVVTSQGCPATGVGEVGTEVFSYNLVSNNGDSKNDNFRIDCITRFPNNNVKIYNRAGILVYEADGYDNNGVVFKGLGERGVYAIGNELPVGTYFYIIDKRDGSKPKTGYLELVR